MRIISSLCTALLLTMHIFATEEIKKADQPKKMVIACPTASLRIEPKEYVAGQGPDEQASRSMFGRFYDQFVKTLPPAYRDPLQDTQLLYNENILCLEELPDDWLKIEALEQYGFNKKEKKWQHVQGYIKKQQAIAVENFAAPTIVVCKPTAKASCFYECSVTLPIGTKLRGIGTLQNSYRVRLLDGRVAYVSDHDVRPLLKYPLDIVALRNNIIDDAKELIGSPYCWGGRSAHNKKNKSNPGSFDCSGLINELYRCNSLEIPRNSNAMYLKSNKIAQGSELQPADCIFFANPEQPERISHVLMYIGSDQVIESCLAKGVAISDARERFGKSLAQLNSGDLIKAGFGYKIDYVITFGSFLNDPALVRELNDYALGNNNILE